LPADRNFRLLFAVQGLSAALLIAGTARIWELVVLQAIYGLAMAFFQPAIGGEWVFRSASCAT